MIVLGFDTATQATVVGLRMADGSTLQARDDPRAGEHPGHATRLLEMAAGLLSRAGVEWAELRRVAVGVGPGRFTGLRVGIATARGLAQSLDVQLVGVSSLRALGLAAARREPTRPILAAIDARRGEAFVAGYLPGAALARERAAGEAPAGEIVVPRALGGEKLKDVIGELERSGAPHSAVGEGWLAVGDGALCFAPELSQGGVEVLEADSPLHAIDAAAICELGALAADAEVDQQVLPDYRRSPDAALAGTRAPALGGTAR
ncbi:MAG TPA: tRNA (adenosine(37)-N6)-threonylcarbamoyltransferase complex dimerization subunit type 1 TsaB [Solirubrobacteraceae bacterium]|nr:tRNA (adenosine(37)-N6)-threonylcarbamoyltransferase complex dimerization subunit type 1 TsaB [Solirubrobacteraceae bacterium]